MIAFLGWFSKTLYDRVQTLSDRVIRLESEAKVILHEDDKKDIESKEFRKDVMAILTQVQKDLQEIKAQVSQEVSLLKHRLTTHEDIHNSIKEDVNSIRVLLNGAKS